MWLETQYTKLKTGETKTAQEWISDMGGFDFAINPTIDGPFDEVLRLSLLEDGLVPA